MNPLPTPAELSLHLQLVAAVAGSCWLLSLVTREYSWVDRIWSIVPPIYVALWAAHADFASPRLDLMTLLTTLWAARLTFNFARKGGYQPGGEDYRWAELRRRMPGWAFQVFNALFISMYQNVLLLLITLPAWQAWTHRDTPLGWLDAVATFGFLGFLVLETVADQQQWNFQEDKRRRKARGEPSGPGFLDQGLFRYSRHPNFFAEQGQWWMVYLFGVAAGAPLLNPSVIGALLLTLLFDGSTRFTEAISASRYPNYRSYQAVTSRLWPWPPRRPMPLGEPTTTPSAR